MPSIKHIILAIIASLGFAANAFAAPISITLTSPTSRTGISDATYALGYNYVKPDVSLNLTGWTYGVKETTTPICTKWKANKPKIDANCKTWGTVVTKSPDNKATQTLVGNFGASNGLGDEKASTPNHAIDNEGGYYDMLLLSFSDLVSLNSIDLGWISGDSDVSILAFNGTNPSQVSPLGKSWESLLGNGWQSAGNYYNVGSSPKNVNPLNITSKYWLVGAYNINLDTNKNNDTTNDYFKLQGIKFTKSIKVPEPSALVLFGLGLLSLTAMRRRKI